MTRINIRILGDFWGPFDVDFQGSTQNGNDLINELERERPYAWMGKSITPPGYGKLLNVTWPDNFGTKR